MKPVSPFPKHHLATRRGVALVIVLAFVVLVTGLIVAFFSRALFNRQVSNSSAAQARADIFVRGAADQIIGDLKQEIADGSSSPATGVTIYTPKAGAAGAAATVMPADQGFTRSYSSGVENDGLNNLLKCSTSGKPFYDKTSNSNYAASGPSRAASISTAGVKINETTPVGPSLNGRYISQARWNKPLLLPAKSTTDNTPSSASFKAPDWILVGRDGSNPMAATTNPGAPNYVVGRYAYNIYDEGGLLDANVAGYPSTSTASQSAYKPALAYADLTQIGLTSTQVDDLVGWRNWASTQAPGTSFTSPGFTAASGINYFNSILSNWTGFLQVSNTTLNNSQSDRMFASRQQLINFLQNGIGLSYPNLQTALQCLTTFSRELSQPSYVRLQSTNASKSLDYNASVPKVLPVSSALPNGGNTGFFRFYSG